MYMYFKTSVPLFIILCIYFIYNIYIFHEFCKLVFLKIKKHGIVKKSHVSILKDPFHIRLTALSVTSIILSATSTALSANPSAILSIISTYDRKKDRPQKALIIAFWDCPLIVNLYFNTSGWNPSFWK